ncbi:cytoplasmic protein [Endothiovibrio diazotrophicus]
MSSDEWPEGVDELFDEILVDAYGDDEALWAFRQALEDGVPVPADAFVIGEPVSLVAFDYDGNIRRGLTARCRRRDGGEYVVAAADVFFTEASEGERLSSAYRKWLGLGPPSVSVLEGENRRKRHKAIADDVLPGSVVELVVLIPRERAVRCRILSTPREITLRTGDAWGMVPGEIVTVRVRKQWSFAGHPYLSGETEARRLDGKALGVVPLRLLDERLWDPAEEYWGEEGEPLDEWARAVIEHGPRPSFEMEQLVPGTDPEDWEEDPILEASALYAEGDPDGARDRLIELLTADLRRLDAHAHLGNFLFDLHPEMAIRHYEMGIRIGELSLGEGFDGVLPWGRLGNRPFLRCLHGYGLCLWRLGRAAEASALFERILWLDPVDRQGVRSLLAAVRAEESWKEGAR